MSSRKNIFTRAELENFTTQKNSAIVKKRARINVLVHPVYMNDKKSGLWDGLFSKLKKYQPDLDGILLGYDSIKAFVDEGEFYGRSGDVKYPVECDCYLFKPALGMELRGVVNVISPDHIGCLVHKVFNATIKRPENEDHEVWNNRPIDFGDTISFWVNDLDYTGVIPYIQGVLEAPRNSATTSVAASTSFNGKLDAEDPSSESGFEENKTLKKAKIKRGSYPVSDIVSSTQLPSVHENVSDSGLDFEFEFLSPITRDKKSPKKVREMTSGQDKMGASCSSKETATAVLANCSKAKATAVRSSQDIKAGKKGSVTNQINVKDTPSKSERPDVASTSIDSTIKGKTRKQPLKVKQGEDMKKLDTSCDASEEVQAKKTKQTAKPKLNVGDMNNQKAKKAEIESNENVKSTKKMKKSKESDEAERAALLEQLLFINDGAPLALEQAITQPPENIIQESSANFKQIVKGHEANISGSCDSLPSSKFSVLGKQIKTEPLSPTKQNLSVEDPDLAVKKIVKKKIVHAADTSKSGASSRKRKAGGGTSEKQEVSVKKSKQMGKDDLIEENSMKAVTSKIKKGKQLQKNVNNLLSDCLGDSAGPSSVNSLGTKSPKSKQGETRETTDPEPSEEMRPTIYERDNLSNCIDRVASGAGKMKEPQNDESTETAKEAVSVSPAKRTSNAAKPKPSPKKRKQEMSQPVEDEEGQFVVPQPIVKKTVKKPVQKRKSAKLDLSGPPATSNQAVVLDKPNVNLEPPSNESPSEKVYVVSPKKPIKSRKSGQTKPEKTTASSIENKVTEPEPENPDEKAHFYFQKLKESLKGSKDHVLLQNMISSLQSDSEDDLF